MATVTKRARGNDKKMPAKIEPERVKCRSCGGEIHDTVTCPRGLCLGCDPVLGGAIRRGVRDHTSGTGPVNGDPIDWCQLLHGNPESPDSVNTHGLQLALELQQGPDGAWLVPVDLIDPSPYQPRRNFDESGMQALAESIKTQGLAQPILVRPVPDARLAHVLGENPLAKLRFQLVAGERRLRAVKQVGWSHIQATVREMSDDQARDLCLTENAQRADLDPLEQAQAWHDWLSRPGATQRELASLLGVDQSHVSLTVRLVELPEKPWGEWLKARAITPAHARHVLPFIGPQEHRQKLLELLSQAVIRTLVAGDVPGVREWQRAVNDTLKSSTCGLSKWVDGNDAAGSMFSGQVRIDAKDPRRADLDLVEISTYEGREKRALNAGLAREILREKEQAWRTKHNITTNKKGRQFEGEGGSKALTPAQRKAAASAGMGRMRGAARTCRRKSACDSLDEFQAKESFHSSRSDSRSSTAQHSISFSVCGPHNSWPASSVFRRQRSSGSIDNVRTIDAITESSRSPVSRKLHATASSRSKSALSSVGRSGQALK